MSKNKMGWPEACVEIAKYVALAIIICAIAHCSQIVKG